jgi:hypothetical protein
MLNYNMNMTEHATIDWYIKNGYKIIDSNTGHSKTTGMHANRMKNPFWTLINDNDDEIILMYCEKNTICKLCPISYSKIEDYEKEHDIKITWFVSTNGYITGNNKLSMHQIIMNCYGNGKGTKTISVDHIDRDKLNNCYSNLRVATFEEQHKNCKGMLPDTKRERKYNAKELPEGITQSMMKKYVVYYQEWANKERTRQRDFFKVERHPKLDKPWCTTKSIKISIHEKLRQANLVVDNLENNIYPKKESVQLLPKYTSLIMFKEKPHLVFDKRVDSGRLNLTMILPEEYDLQEQLEILNDKIREKYNIDIIL